MFTPRLFIPMFLIGGLVVIEVLSGHSAAQSQRTLTPEETGLILSILNSEKPVDAQVLEPKDIPFIELQLPGSPVQITETHGTSIGTIYGQPQTAQPLAPPPNSSEVLSDLLPPISSPLYYAYQDGGRLWYQKDDNGLVIFPDETIQSFNLETGAPSLWLQDKLAKLPVAEPGAYDQYQNIYQAKVVAKTSTWVLMEFPSGGVVKVLKPEYATPATPTESPDGLPSILPGYENQPTTTPN